MEKIKNFYNENSTAIDALLVLITLAIIYSLLEYKFNFFENNNKPNNNLKLQFFGFALTVGSIIIASRQFRKNHLWNRKITAIESALKVKSDTEPAIQYLTKIIDYRDTSSKKYYTVDFLHEKMCIKKKEAACPEDKYELDPRTRKYKVSKEGRKFIRHLNTLLNNYEYLAAGIRNGIFDEDTVKSIYRGAMIKCYNNFSAYIEHYNTEMAPERSSTIWINLKKLALEWSESDKKELETKTGRIKPVA